ncbi:MAG: HD-GYP domain-containing protein [Azovibrio sp.]
MIKKIDTVFLIPGMFIHDLNSDWLDHPFLSNRLLVKDEKTADKIRTFGIREVYIDTAKGLDVSNAPTQEEVQTNITKRLEEISQDVTPQSTLRASLAEEIEIAKHLQKEANRIVKNLMMDIRLGAEIERNKLDPMVENMVDSIFSNKNALLPLVSLKHHDEYTFEHSVSTCALMIAFARGLDLPRSTIKEIALGALLHDVGKARVPDEILNKPAKLTDAELVEMKSHVVQSIILLQHTPGISDMAFNVASQHHERFDGSGYPNALKGDQISVYGQMASIIDVYDAISSDRSYHKGASPASALRKLLEWSDHHFDPLLVHNFIRAIGIYPSGSLVRLESDRLAVVLEQNEQNLLYPTVQVIYHADRQFYLPPEIIDLTQSQDRIVSHEDFAKWNINPRKFSFNQVENI